MSLSTAIKVENLSKRYVIGHQKQEKYTALRDVIVQGMKGFGRKLMYPLQRNRNDEPSCTQEEFWALDDISFEINHGDRVGIIGRNGAGKSTLLKILSRITDPTIGRIGINGRVASLLEVGTGFHPELTGRENIYLNGAILGMSKAEIRRKFDEIVDFSEVERFLDVPVKRYSSGMYVRLAFAVAAHLEPEILVVDEVLAVGDSEFQKKCLGKMEGVAREGRTVLFVSHNLSAIETLCDTCLHLRSGRLVGQGNVHEQIQEYRKTMFGKGEERLSAAVELGDGVRLTRFEMTPNPVESGGAVDFLLEFLACDERRIESVAILFYSATGGRLAVVDLRQADRQYYMDGMKPLVLRGTISTLPFVEGEYSVGMYYSSGKIMNNFLDLIHVTVLPKRVCDSIVPYPANVRGVVNLRYAVAVDA